MTPSRLAVFVLFVAACGSSGNANPDPPDETPPEHPTPATAPVALPGIDISSLGAAEQRGFYRIVEGVNSPCGQAMSIARCVREGATCPACARAANYAVRLLSTGYPVDNARELVKDRFAADSAVEVSTEGCVWQGNPTAPVTIVEFADFECPHCKLAHEMFHTFFEQMQFASNVRLCYRFFPLAGHENARPAAHAAVAAANQGKFWQMSALLYENQEALSPTKYAEFATRLGLDLTRFRADLESAATEAVVQRDRTSGERLEIEGTPSFFVNGRRYGESPDPDSMRTYIAEELAR